MSCERDASSEGAAERVRRCQCAADETCEATPHRHLIDKAIIKVDFVCRKNETFRLLEFERRRKVTIGDFETWIVSREDLVLSKLLWSKDSQSPSQRQDVANLLKEDCDFGYLHDWAATLGVSSELQSLLP